MSSVLYMGRAENFTTSADILKACTLAETLKKYLNRGNNIK